MKRGMSLFLLAQALLAQVLMAQMGLALFVGANRFAWAESKTKETAGKPEKTQHPERKSVFPDYEFQMISPAGKR